ncbi:MAG: tetratricopeptide repeat protein [Acidobacteriota bacterium]
MTTARVASMTARGGLWVRLLPILIALVVNLGALTPGFIHDDHRLIEQNELIRDTARIPEILSRGYWSVDEVSVPNLYRPLTILSFALNHAVGGIRPFGYRAVNLLLHLLVTLLVVALARRTLGARSRGQATVLPLAAGVLFAVHPVHTEVLGEVVGRAELLAAAGVLGSVLAFLLARERAGGERGVDPRWAVLGLACLAVGFLSKENAVVAPVLALAADRLIVRRRLAWGYHLASFGLVAALLGIRIAVLGGLNPAGPAHFIDNPIAQAQFWPGLLTAIAVLGRYASLLVAPLSLSIDYSYDAIPLVGSPLDPWLLVGLMAGAAWIGGLAGALRRSAAVAFGLIWIGVAIAPVANLSFTIGTIMAERLLYLPSVGFCLLAAAGLGALLARADAASPSGSARGGGIRILGLVVLLAFASRSVVRLRDWKDDHAIFSAAVAVHPNSVRSLFNYAAACEERDQDDDARRAYERAISIYGRFDEAHYNLAGLHARHGEWDDAVEHYRESLVTNPSNPRHLVNLGHSLNGRGSFVEARAVLERAIRADPGSGEAHTNLGAALLGLNEPVAAVEVYRAAIRLEPENAEYHRNLGLALKRADRPAEAAKAFQRSLALRPGDVELNAVIGLALLDAGEITAALAALREAVRLSGSHPVFIFQLGRALELAGRVGEAEQRYRESIRLAPSAPVPLKGLGMLLYRKGDRDEARALLERAAGLDAEGTVIDDEASRALEDLRRSAAP